MDVLGSLLERLSDGQLSEEERCNVIKEIDALDDERAGAPMLRCLEDERTPQLVKVHIAICLGNHLYQPVVPHIVKLVLMRSQESGSLLWALKGLDYLEYVEALVDILATNVFECSNKCMLLIENVLPQIDAELKKKLIDRLTYYRKIYAAGHKPPLSISIDIPSTIAFIDETRCILAR